MKVQDPPNWATLSASRSPVVRPSSMRSSMLAAVISWLRRLSTTSRSSAVISPRSAFRRSST